MSDFRTALDTFPDGTVSLIQVRRPRFADWRECPLDALRWRHTNGPIRSFFHDKSSLAVLSAVEYVADGNADGPEFHISISRQHRTLGTRRCSSTEARWVLKQFGLEEAVEDNHVPGGLVRNFWRPVADAMVGYECHCVAGEPAIVEDRGDYVWRHAG